jgi:hypothetical protein
MFALQRARDEQIRGHRWHPRAGRLYSIAKPN